MPSCWCRHQPDPDMEPGQRGAGLPGGTGLRVKLPGADPLQEKYREDFNNKAETLLAKLDLVREVQFASTM